MNHDHYSPNSLKGKQKIELLLNDDGDNSEQFYNTCNQDNLSRHIDAKTNPTEKEMQYIRRIYSLMSLVSKQTKEIQSLRSIIEAYSQQESESCIHCNHTTHNRKRNKPS